MENCGWLYLTEYVEYFSAMSLWNLKWRQIPLHFTFKISNGQQTYPEYRQPKPVTDGKQYRPGTHSLQLSDKSPAYPDLSLQSESGLLIKESDHQTDNLYMMTTQ